MNISETIERLAIATRANGRSSRTVEAYREKLTYLVTFLKNVPIEDVTTHDLRRYIANLWDQELSPFTVKSRVQTLKLLFNFCEAEGILEHNPADRIKTPNPKRKVPKCIEWNDFRRLLGTTEAGDVIDLRDEAIMMFLADTGCRVGGLTGLKPENLDLERRRATVTEKGGETRPVFYMEPTEKALRAWLEVRPNDKGPWLFVGLTARAKGQMNAQSVNKMLKRRGKRGGCKGSVNPHAFRHAFARDYLLSGGDLGTLSDLMGHSSVSITKEYYGIFTTGELQHKHNEHSPIRQLEEEKEE